MLLWVFSLREIEIYCTCQICSFVNLFCPRSQQTKAYEGFLALFTGVNKLRPIMLELSNTAFKTNTSGIIVYTIYK